MNIIKFLNDITNIDESIFENVEKLDLTNDEDYNLLINEIKKLKDNPMFALVGSLFGVNDETLDELLNNVNEEREKLINKQQKENLPIKKSANVIEKQIEDKSVIERPSQNIDVNAGLQIHKLVQEYIDTMIKPYNPKVGGLTTEQVNDAYAGLYEFACWIYNKN